MAFEKRQRDIQRKHSRLAKGYSTRLLDNGVFEHRPVTEVGRGFRGPIVILLAAYFAIKILFLLSLGAEEYAGHLAALEGGSLGERIGAAVMGIDPVTRAAADVLAGFL